MVLSRGSLLYSVFMFTIKWFSDGDAYEHKDTTNLCFFLRALVIKLPLVIILGIIIGPIVIVFMGLGEAWRWGKSKLPRRTKTYKPWTGPSKTRVIYDTIHGRICPTVTFE